MYKSARPNYRPGIQFVESFVSSDGNAALKMAEGRREEVDSVVVRFAGDSGDGIQLTGGRFTETTAISGQDLETFPDFPAEIRAPIGTTYGWQMMGAGFGMASGAAIGGLLRDITGDFNLTMALSLALSTVGVISILRLPSTSQPTSNSLAKCSCTLTTSAPMAVCARTNFCLRYAAADT